MFMSKIKIFTMAVLLAGCVLAATGFSALTAQQTAPPQAQANQQTQAEVPEPLAPEQYAKLKRMILPQPGENPFWQIAWLEDVWEARQKAAAQGKPMFVWGGSEGAPITNC